jgi:hypothetical protein
VSGESRQPVAAAGAGLALLGLLGWAVGQVLRVELGR